MADFQNDEQRPNKFEIIPMAGIEIECSSGTKLQNSENRIIICNKQSKNMAIVVSIHFSPFECDSPNQDSEQLRMNDFHCKN